MMSLTRQDQIHAEATLRASGRCEFGRRGCGGGGVRFHQVTQGAPQDASNVLLLCRPCGRYLSEHPDLAQSLMGAS